MHQHFDRVEWVADEDPSSSLKNVESDSFMMLILTSTAAGNEVQRHHGLRPDYPGPRYRYVTILQCFNLFYQNNTND